MSPRRLLSLILATAVGLAVAASIAHASTQTSRAHDVTTSTNTTTSTTSTTTTTTSTSTVPSSILPASALFGCRAGVAPIYLGSATEPLVDVGSANEPTTPCQTAQSTVQTVPVGLDSANLNLGTVGPAGAQTYETGVAQSVPQPGAASVANIQAVNLDIPGTGVLTIVGPVLAETTIQCENDQPVMTGQSTLDAIYLNGQETTLPSPGAAQTIQLGGGAYLALNEQVSTATSIEENVIDLHLADGVELIVGQAYVGLQTPTSCANTEPVITTSTSSSTSSSSSVTTQPNLEECPDGTTYEITGNVCVIVVPGGPTIIVSPPFRGPSGGTAMTIATARHRYGPDPCLSSKGQQRYAYVATRRGARVIGTLKADRILALGPDERVSALGGNDCVYSKGGNAHLYDGNGNDTIYVGGGRNRVAVGNGNNVVYGRSIRGARGRDWITDGNGNNRVYGGLEATRIDDGLGKDRISGGPARNRIFIGSGIAQVNCGTSGHNTLYARPHVAAYGRRHGCQHVVLLH